MDTFFGRKSGHSDKAHSRVIPKHLGQFAPLVPSERKESPECEQIFFNEARQTAKRSN